MGKYINKEVIKKKQDEQDKDMVIADLTQQLAEAQQQINDMSMVIVDLQTKVAGGTV